MKLSDIFKKKKAIGNEKPFVKIDKKKLAQITGGVELTTKSTGVVTDNKHPEGIY